MWEAPAFRGARLFGWQMSDGTWVPKSLIQARLLIRSRSLSQSNGGSASAVHIRQEAPGAQGMAAFRLLVEHLSYRDPQVNPSDHLAQQLGDAEHMHVGQGMTLFLGDPDGVGHNQLS
jgi:hypothetical protein